jgi:predicted MPP superfamily phosphohydrolase
MIDNPKNTFTKASMSDHINSLTWLTDLHLEFCSHRTRNQLYQSINLAAGEIVVITGDLSAGPHRLARYTELAEQIRKPVYFELGNHDRYGTTFANAEAVVERVTTLFSHMVRLDGSQVIPLKRATWHEGSPSSPDYQPFFSSPTMGNMIKAAAAVHPGKSVLVLCGHTHSPGIYRDGNILVLTAGAR